MSQTSGRASLREVPEIRQRLVQIGNLLRELLTRLEEEVTSRVDRSFVDEDLVVVSRVHVENAVYVTTRFAVDGRAGLSSREHEIAQLVAAGLQNKEIAARLNLSSATVAAHLQRIFRKLNVKSRASLARHVLLYSQSSFGSLIDND